MVLWMVADIECEDKGIFKRERLPTVFGRCARTLSENSDVVGIASKLSDILIYLFQGCHLIVCAVVARSAAFYAKFQTLIDI